MNDQESQGLIERMRCLADTGHVRSDELRKMADALEAACKSGNALMILGRWAKARCVWCEITGESLV